MNSLKTRKDTALKIEELSTRESITIDEAGYVNKMRAYYGVVNRNLSFVDTRPTDAIQMYMSCKTTIYDILIDGETNTEQTEKHKSSADIQIEINVEKRELERLEKLKDAASSAPRGYSEAKVQSRTLENYMDYTQHAGSISQAADVWRMVFYHWQWEQMRNTGKTNGYLVLNSN